MGLKQFKWTLFALTALLSSAAQAFDILEYFPDFHEKAAVYQSISAKGMEENFHTYLQHFDLHWK